MKKSSDRLSLRDRLRLRLDPAARERYEALQERQKLREISRKAHENLANGVCEIPEPIEVEEHPTHTEPRAVGEPMVFGDRLLILSEQRRKASGRKAIEVEEVSIDPDIFDDMLQTYSQQGEPEPTPEPEPEPTIEVVEESVDEIEATPVADDDRAALLYFSQLKR